MEIRKTHPEDLLEILGVYESARRHMLKNGNPHQWTNGYPDRNVVIMDIEKQHHFSCTDGNRLLGCFALMKGEDPTYAEMISGNWLNPHPYATLHRLAVLEHGRGIGSAVLNWCLNRHGNIRADTHRDNIAMQRLLIKKGFSHCGVIANRWGDERLAFQTLSA